METKLIKRIGFGLLRIDVNELNVNVKIENFMNGTCFEINFDCNKFGTLQDFGNTLEHVFLLFVNKDLFHVIGFDSTRNASQFLIKLYLIISFSVYLNAFN